MKKRMAFVFPATLSLCLSSCNSQAASIGIIGGADGPTAIFVSSNINWLQVGIIAGIIVIAAILIYRNKKKK